MSHRTVAAAMVRVGGSVGMVLVAGVVGALTVGSAAWAAPTAAAQDGSGQGSGPDSDDEPTAVLGQTSNDGAVMLTPGWYRTTAPPNDGSLRYYHVKRTIPGSTVSVGVLSQAPGELAGGSLKLWLKAPDGTECALEETWEQEMYVPKYSMHEVVLSTQADGDAGQRCADADWFELQVAQGDYSNEEFTGTRVDLVVNEEPKATNAARMPEPADIPEWQPLSSSLDRTAVKGTPRPENATKLTPGSYRSTIETGELLFYRVDLDWGQALQAHVRVQQPDAELGAKFGYDKQLGLQVLGPTYGNSRTTENDMEDTNHVNLSPDGAVEAKVMTPRVRYLDRTSDTPDRLATSTAGSYYLAVVLSESEEPFEVPFELEIGRQGERGGEPSYARGETPVGPAWPEPSPVESDEDNDTTALVLGGSGLVLFLAGTGTLIGTRRGIRRRNVTTTAGSR